MKTTEELLGELESAAEKLSSTKHLPIDSLHMAVGLSSEAGELLGIEKKAYFQNHPIDELSVKLDYRYPGGEFDEAASVNRNPDAERYAAQLLIDADRKVR